MILFDLDGTLVDSATEIKACMMHAWAVVSTEPFPHDRLKIGPPLRATAVMLAPGANEDTLDAFVAAFKSRYDTSDYALTQPFPGIVDVLDEARARGQRLGIATNKRRIPTEAILKRWLAGRFDLVLCGDDGAADKAEAIRGTPGVVALVGDTAADVEAARAAGVRAIAVTWGYDSRADLERAAPDVLVTALTELSRVLSETSTAA